MGGFCCRTLPNMFYEGNVRDIEDFVSFETGVVLSYRESSDEQ